MKQLKKLTLNGHFDIVQSTQNDLNGFHILDDTIYKNQPIKLQKDDELKEFDVSVILQITEEKYHILNSNMSIIIQMIQ